MEIKQELDCVKTNGFLGQDRVSSYFPIHANFASVLYIRLITTPIWKNTPSLVENPVSHGRRKGVSSFGFSLVADCTT